MAQNLYADHSNLTYTILAVSHSVVGVQTANDIWRKNLETFSANILNNTCYMDIWCNFFDRIVQVAKQLSFGTSFESYFDIHAPFQLREAILTGSVSEGLVLYNTTPTDMDFMCVLKNISFSQEDQESGSLMLQDDTPFVDTFIKSGELQNMWSEFLHEEGPEPGKHRLSSAKLKEKLRENFQKTGEMFSVNTGGEKLDEVSDGAAITIRKQKPALSLTESIAEYFKMFWGKPRNEIVHDQSPGAIVDQFVHEISYLILPSCDIVLAIFCDGWPSCAQEWIKRERFWPDIHSVKKISQSGFHIVPKSSPEGDFRLSFSCAETKLIATLSPLQHKVTRSFKAVFKYHENNWSPKLKGIISSYHLKTIAFWHFEKTPQESCTKETLVHHLVSLLEELEESLRNQNLQMYFMPKVNLFQDVDDSEAVLDLIERISQLCRDFSAIREAIEINLSISNATETIPELLEKPFERLLAETAKKFKDGEEGPSTLLDFVYRFNSFT